ncbi:MAG: FAD-dependent oxidoreductase, partial [Micropruina sp.]
MKTVIIGGVAGGMSAATRLRRLDERAEIVVLERSGYVSFANCGLPYYVGGVIENRNALLLQTPKSLGDRFALDVRVHHEVTAIDPAAKTVSITNLATGERLTESYDNLVLSPGASPFLPPIPGIERALTLRTVEDVDTMMTAVAIEHGDHHGDPGEPDEAPTAVIMGAGFIGVELAENLVHRGFDVTVVELADQVMAPLDPEMAALVQRALEAHGVRVLTGVQVTAIGESTATTSAGEELPADLVVAAIGVRPESGLAAKAGLEVDQRGGIVVDAQQRTSAADIYAVGDAVTKIDGIAGGATLTPLANPANRQGRLVADVIAGRNVGYQP